MTNQTTKNQHYVPQFLLAGFGSTGGDKPKVNVFDLERNVVRQNQAVKEVFSENYFYDKNNEIENFLSLNIEGPASQIIKSIRNDDFSVLGDGRVELIKFICCQNSRTVEGREDALKFINAHFHRIISDFSRLNGFQINNPEGFNIRPSDKDSMRLFNSAQALRGVIDSGGMEDLEFHILINKTNVEFVISDHAVARYNWLYRDLADPRIGSMLAKGVQLFLPLSERVSLCAYDAKIYKYGSKSSSVSKLILESDVYWLNQLQMRNAHSLIAFKSMFMEGFLKKLRESFYGEKVYSRKSHHLEREDLGGELLKMTNVVYTEQVKLRDKPTFFKVLKKSKKSALHFDERDPGALMDLLMPKEAVREAGVIKI